MSFCFRTLVLLAACGLFLIPGLPAQDDSKAAAVKKAAVFPKNSEWVNQGDCSADAKRTAWCGGDKAFDAPLTLVYFWDYTTINNIRELSYIEKWIKAYEPLGLQVIFIHTPEFPFAHRRENVEKAVERLGLSFPVMLDNEGKLWEQYGNRSWPTKHLVDSSGNIIHTQAGEGMYVSTELAIREALAKNHPESGLPDFVIREDKDRFNIWECGDMSTELYVGFKRAAWWGVEIANRSGVFPNQILNYKDRGKRLERGFFLEGRWANNEHYFEYMDKKDEWNDYLGFIYVGKEVYGVLSNVENSEGLKVYVTRDEEPVPEEKRGADIQADESGKTYITVREPRLYYLISGEDDNYHELRFYPKDKGFAVYVLSFSNGCLTDFNHA